MQCPSTIESKVPEFLWSKCSFVIIKCLCEKCNYKHDKNTDIICIQCDTNRMYNESLKTKQSKSDINSPSSGESSSVALISKKSDSELLCEEQSLYLPEGDLSVFNKDKDSNLSIDFFQDPRACIFIEQQSRYALDKNISYWKT